MGANLLNMKIQRKNETIENVFKLGDINIRSSCSDVSFFMTLNFQCYLAKFTLICLMPKKSQILKK